MKKTFVLLMLSLFFFIGCAAISKQERLSSRSAHKTKVTLREFLCFPVDASERCQIDSAANSVSSIQNGVKVTLKFLTSEEKRERIRGKGVFPESIFAAVLVSIENGSDSKIRVPFSQTVLICNREQFDVLTYREAILLAMSSTAEYAQRAAEPYLRAGLSPTFARQQVANQSFQAIYEESGLADYDWIEEKPTLTVFPTVRTSRILLWDASKLGQKISNGERIRVIIPDVVLGFDPTGRPCKTVDFWFDFQVQE